MLKENLGHLFAVLEGVHRRLRDEQRVLLGHAAKLVVQAVVPNLCHVVPIGDDAVLERIPGLDVTIMMPRKDIGSGCYNNDVKVGYWHTY